jgi:type IV pilus assembly protein PilN
MLQINLLPVRAERRREFIRKQLSILVLSLFLAIAAMGFTYYRLQMRCNQAQHQLSQTNKKIKRLEPVIKKIEQYKKQKAEISRKIAVIIDLDQHRPAPVIILDDLNRQRPEKLWYTTISKSAGQLKISGIARDNETVVTLLNNLNHKSRLLNKSDLTLLRSQKIENITLKGFSINCPIDLSYLNQKKTLLGQKKKLD